MTTFVLLQQWRQSQQNVATNQDGANFYNFKVPQLNTFNVQLTGAQALCLICALWNAPSSAPARSCR